MSWKLRAASIIIIIIHLLHGDGAILTVEPFIELDTVLCVYFAFQFSQSNMAIDVDMDEEYWKKKI